MAVDVAVAVAFVAVMVTALDAHHSSPMMTRIAELRDKYDLHMKVERFADLDGGDDDKQFIRE